MRGINVKWGEDEHEVKVNLILQEFLKLWGNLGLLGKDDLFVPLE